MRDFKKNISKKYNIGMSGPLYKGYYLRPVEVNMTDAEKMARWRAGSYESFFTWIKPGPADVLEWLKGYEKDEHDIIFIVESNGKAAAGQMSLYNIDFDKKTAEFGRIIRGDVQAPKGIMTSAAKVLLQWGYNDLGIKEFYLHVFADIQKAVALYERLGFTVTDTLSYGMICGSDKITRWAESGDFSSADKGRKVYKMVLKIKY